ncbi:MAG: hypothetical protein PVG98_08635 [Chromatiales bacterium]|jgi:hypothetical protein
MRELAQDVLPIAVLTVAAVLGGCATAIPDGPGLEAVPVFEGTPASPRPLPPKAVAPHPLLGTNSVFHDDHYNSDVSDFPAPLGLDPRVLSRFYLLCGTPRTDSRGRVITLCADWSNPGGTRLYLLDPDSLEALASIPFDGGGATGTQVGGGNYPHVTAEDRVINGGPAGTLDVYEILDRGPRKPAWRLTRAADLSPWIEPGDALFDIAPDFDGLYWFATAHGRVGYLDPESGGVRTLDLPGERVENGMAVGPHGVYVVTDAALYRFGLDPADGAPAVVWREPYAVDPDPKPGLFSRGSGSTPTLLGEELVAITDNAPGRVNLLVYRRAEAVPGDRLVCSVPLFDEGASGVDVSPIGYGDSLVVANWIGAPGPLDLPNDTSLPGFIGDYRAMPGGLIRVDVRSDRSGCDPVWELSGLRTTSVPKLSTATGLVYTLTQRIDAFTEAVDPPLDAWYLTAVDFRTGERVWDLLLGTGPYLHNGFLTPTIGPNGALYQAVLGGIVKVSDGAAGPGYRARYHALQRWEAYRRYWAARSRSYRLESVREEPIRRTDCTREQLLETITGLFDLRAPACGPRGS